MGDSYKWCSLAGLSHYWWSTDRCGSRPGSRSVWRRYSGSKSKPTLLPHERVNEATPNRYIVAGEASDVTKIIGESSMFQKCCYSNSQGTQANDWSIGYGLGNP